MTGDVDDVMPGSDGLKILEFEKTVSWDLGLDEARRFSKLAEAKPFGVYEMCRTFVDSVSQELTMYDQSA